MDSYCMCGYFFVLFVFIIKSVQTIQFCESYVENNKQIDYGFRKVEPNEYDSNSYLFIDNQYWDLDFYQNSVDRLKTLQLYSEGRQSKHWFGRQYSMAFSLWQTEQNITIFGLIYRNESLIDFRFRVGLKGNDHKLKEYVKLFEKNITFSDGFKPTIAFVPNRAEHKEKVVVFVQQSRTSDETFDTIYKLYQFDGQFRASYAHNRTLIAEVEPTALNQLDPELEVLSIFAQISWTQVDNGMRLEKAYGLIILFKFNKQIKYCWTTDRQLSHECKKENLKLLIDCSAYGNEVSEEYVLDYNLITSSFSIILIVSFCIAIIVYIRFTRIKHKTQKGFGFKLMDERDEPRDRMHSLEKY